MDTNEPIWTTAECGCRFSGSISDTWQCTVLPRDAETMVVTVSDMQVRRHVENTRQAMLRDEQL